MQNKPGNWKSFVDDFENYLNVLIDAEGFQTIIDSCSALNPTLTPTQSPFHKPISDSQAWCFLLIKNTQVQHKLEPNDKNKKSSCAPLGRAQLNDT